MCTWTLVLAYATTWPFRLAQVKDHAIKLLKAMEAQRPHVYTSATVLGLTYLSPWPISCCTLMIIMWPPHAREGQVSRSSWSPTNSSEHSNLITHFGRDSPVLHINCLVQSCSDNQWQGLYSCSWQCQEGSCTEPWARRDVSSGHVTVLLLSHAGWVNQMYKVTAIQPVWNSIDLNNHNCN